jgi:adenine phosphoribosyltransferase
VRKRRYGLPGEVSLQQTTGYARTDMFINGISKGDRVVIVDDVISTGGTLKAIIKAFQGMGVQIVDVIVVVEKGDRKAEVESELGVRIKTLVKVEMRKGRVAIIT